MLDEIEDCLADGRAFVFGKRLTDAGVRLFVTLVRFDIYHIKRGYYSIKRSTRQASCQ